MSNTPTNEHDEMLRLLRDNVRLAEENNVILKKIHRNEMIGLTLRVVWYTVLIGLPFAVYFYFLEPYFEAFGANYDLFRQGMGEIPGLKGLEYLIP